MNREEILKLINEQKTKYAQTHAIKTPIPTDSIEEKNKRFGEALDLVSTVVAILGIKDKVKVEKNKIIFYLDHSQLNVTSVIGHGTNRFVISFISKSNKKQLMYATDAAFVSGLAWAILEGEGGKG